MKKLINITAFLIISVVTFFYSVPSLAGRNVSVPVIEIQKLGNYRGQYITLYYGFEKTNVIRADKDLISLSDIRLTSTLPINADSVQFPAVQIEKTGVRGAYDIVVAVVTPYRNFVWKNGDGSFPDGLTDSKVYQSSVTAYRKSSDIDQFVEGNPTATYTWPLN
jgi:hypothetical protein